MKRCTMCGWIHFMRVSGLFTLRQSMTGLNKEVVTMKISDSDRAILRKLASRQMELASSETMHRLYQEWVAHGCFSKTSRPMIRIELETFEQDILPLLMQCESEAARVIEHKLLSLIVNHTLFSDDTLVPAYYPLVPVYSFTPFGLPVKKHETDGVGHRFIPYISDLEKDFDKLHPSTFSADEYAVSKEQEQADVLFGDILPVRREDGCLSACLTQDIVHIMDMQDMYLAMYDSPELFKRMMDMLANDYCSFFDMLEKQGQLQSAASSQHLNQGSYCFTDTLPDRKPAAVLSEMWLYMDSQETSGVSPDMYAEFIFPYYKKIMERFGAVSYGCCEAVHPIWGDCLSKVGNIRKISISPWCDERQMGERLAGADIVYLRKPTPNLLGVGAELDEVAVRECFRETATAARGCKLEIAQRDVYQLNNTSDKVKRYVELIRSTLDTYWR